MVVGALCPYYNVVSVNLPNPTRVTSSEGVGRGRLRLVLFNLLKKPCK